MATNGSDSGIVSAVDTTQAMAVSTPTVTASTPDSHTLSFLIPGMAKLNFDVQYTGAPDELARADLIAATVLNNVLVKVQSQGSPSYLDDPVMMPQTTAWKNWYSQQAQVLSDAGYPVSGDGLRAYMVENNGVLNFIKNAKTAKEVIDKYGSKVPENKDIPKNILGARKKS